MKSRLEMLKGNTIIRYIIMFLTLVLLQVLVFNRIAIFNYATPFIYVYFIIKLPISLNRNFLLLLGFILGFTIDVFCNTPGVNALSTTVAAFLQQPFRRILYSTDDYSTTIPSYQSLKNVFVKLLVMTVLIHHTILIGIESFSYINILMLILRILSSTLLTAILIFGIEGLSTKRKLV